MLKISELLKDPKRYTKGCLARDAKSRPVRPECDKATKWCLVGAIMRCYPHDFKLISNRLNAALDYQKLPPSLIYFNDHPETTHQMVMDLVKCAEV